MEPTIIRFHKTNPNIKTKKLQKQSIHIFKHKIHKFCNPIIQSLTKYLKLDLGFKQEIAKIKVACITYIN
jgi:hypothetical protein